MGDPVLMTVVGVGAALTKMFLRACDVASAADLIGDGQELLGTLLRLSRRSDGSKGLFIIEGVGVVCGVGRVVAG